MIKIHLAINKKHYFALHSLIISFLIYFFTVTVEDRGIIFIIFLNLLIISLYFFTHRPNIRFFDIIISSIPSLLLAEGFIMTYYYFPNLSSYFKIFSVFIFFALFYSINLVNNIFLVVHTRKEIIPLYRVAVTWSKILSAFIGIPLLAGIFKIPLIMVYSSLLASFTVLMFFIYFVWAMQFNPDIKIVKRGELLTLFGLGCFIIGVATVGVSFFPNESFLRALYISAVLIFCTSYIEGHLKNSINKKLLLEHLVILVIFLIILIIFNP